jgi:hypothetical protein
MDVGRGHARLSLIPRSDHARVVKVLVRGRETPVEGAPRMAQREMRDRRRVHRAVHAGDAATALGRRHAVEHRHAQPVPSRVGHDEQRVLGRRRRRRSLPGVDAPAHAHARGDLHRIVGSQRRAVCERVGPQRLDRGVGGLSQHGRNAGARSRSRRPPARDARRTPGGVPARRRRLKGGPVRCGRRAHRPAGVLPASYRRPAAVDGDRPAQRLDAVSETDERRAVAWATVVRVGGPAPRSGTALPPSIARRRGRASLRPPVRPRARRPARDARARQRRPPSRPSAGAWPPDPRRGRRVRRAGCCPFPAAPRCRRSRP